MEKLKVTAFGGFSMSMGGVALNGLSRKTRLLLEYFVVFKGRGVTREELIELLGATGASGEGDSGGATGASGALNSRIHRLKEYLKRLSPNVPVIINTHGTYRFNPSIECVFDFEEFERLYKDSLNTHRNREKLMLLLRAIELYKGDFLPNRTGEKWALPLNLRYRDMYADAVHTAIRLLEKENRFNEIIPLCRAAVAAEPHDITLHERFIRALMSDGDRKGALTHCVYTMDLLRTKFGDGLPDEISALYNELIGGDSAGEVHDSDIAIESLSESEDVTGAFYCEYEVFRQAYIVEIRRSKRHKRDVNVFLLTLTRDPVKAGKRPLDKRAVESAMGKLFYIINDSLRVGDIFARYSPSQYIMMLRFMTRENCEAILKRLESRYREENILGAETFVYEFQPLTEEDYSEEENKCVQPY